MLLRVTGSAADIRRSTTGARRALPRGLTFRSIHLREVKVVLPPSTPAGVARRIRPWRSTPLMIESVEKRGGTLRLARDGFIAAQPSPAILAQGRQRVAAVCLTLGWLLIGVALLMAAEYWYRWFRGASSQMPPAAWVEGIGTALPAQSRKSAVPRRL